MKKITFQIIMTFVIIAALTIVSFNLYRSAIIKNAIEKRENSCIYLSDEVNLILNESIANSCECFFDQEYFGQGVECICDCAIENIDIVTCESRSGCYFDKQNNDCRCRYPISKI